MSKAETFADMSKRWRGQYTAFGCHDSCCHGECADELDAQVAKLRALAEEWKRAEPVAPKNIANTYRWCAERLLELLGEVRP